MAWRACVHGKAGHTGGVCGDEDHEVRKTREGTRGGLFRGRRIAIWATMMMMLMTMFGWRALPDEPQSLRDCGGRDWSWVSTLLVSASVLLLRCGGKWFLDVPWMGENCQ